MALGAEHARRTLSRPRRLTHARLVSAARKVIPLPPRKPGWAFTPRSVAGVAVDLLGAWPSMPTRASIRATSIRTVCARQRSALRLPMVFVFR